MFLRDDHGLGGGGGTVTFGRALAAPAPDRLIDRLRDRAEAIDWTPDLGARIGSAEWFRGAATCLALLAGAWFLSPGLAPRPLIGAAPAPLQGSEWDEARAQSIAPIAWGATTGRHVAAGDLVAPLAETPERPIIELTATLGQGDDLSSAIERAGVSNDDADQVAELVSRRMALDDLKPGTRLDLTLGRRASKSVPRPLEKLAFRARFDLELTIAREDGRLTLTPRPIAIDHTPLRIEGLVGSSLYRSARAAGVPATIVAAYLKAIASHVSIGRVGSSDRFDFIIQRDRAATGEVRLGDLLFAGLDQGHGDKLQLVRWQDDGETQWFSASGKGMIKQAGGGLPVAGHITSTFGRRYHPILHYYRMHEGIDVGAPYGTPIHATAAGTVTLAGHKGGYGNFVSIDAGHNLSMGFGHMSRIAVHRGQHVAAGQVIGYVGSTGLSTGPHVHYEVRRGGRPINPLSVKLTSMAQLAGADLRKFKAQVANLLAVKPASAQLASK
ncbi:M23 family metallopeptidase [Hephaestia mangrovi]|uniref:M23 family metallopeptidase n=1 Tax=Hephaestia mangrovi TaxID=2873268 RepID=UPI001CA75318|nr:M23 family metallopeptidase [Hephaestia mangrovi]